MLLQAEDIERRIGGRTLYRGVAFQIRAGDRVGLLGPNGAGKSTLLRNLAEIDTADKGRISKPRGTRVALLRQEIDPRNPLPVRDEVASALVEINSAEVLIRELESEIEKLGDQNAIPEDLAERYDRAQTDYRQHGGYERDARVAATLAGLGFDEQARQQPVRSFSGGWLMRMELAKLLLSLPDVLLLDEPTNHLDLPAIEWFEETLATFRGGVVIVSHDRSFLRRHVNRVAELDGTGRFSFYEGNYQRYLEQREQNQATQFAQKKRQDRQIAHMEKFVERFRAKATKARQAQSRVKALERMERIEVEAAPTRRLRFRIPPPPRSGSRVLTLKDIHKSYGEASVYSGVSLSLERGESVALVGANGAGKSTLLKIAAGQLDFESGTRALGHNVDIAFFAQHQLEELEPSRTVLEELASIAQTDDFPRLRGHLGAFLFSGDDVEKRVSVLSGGEKARLALAKLLLRPRNLLILDEPTNHLDVEACEVIEEALREFSGTLLFVSHDRSFINALTTRVIDVAGGHLDSFPGNYDDFHSRKTIVPKEPAKKTNTEDTASAPRKREHRQEERRLRKSREKVARRIERLEGDILENEERQQTLQWEAGSKDAYRDPERMRELELERTQNQERIANLYREWDRLADELAALDDSLESFETVGAPLGTKPAIH